MDLSEVLESARKLADDEPRVASKLAEIASYAAAPGAPAASLVLMAKLGVVVTEWMERLDLEATAIQCWTSLQQNYGVNCCTLMSMMSENLMPSACEVDITGVVAMYALQLASGNTECAGRLEQQLRRRSRQVRLLPLRQLGKVVPARHRDRHAPILGTTLGVENTYGALEGRTPSGPLTYARFNRRHERTDRGYVGEGAFTDDPLNTFGNRAVVHVPELQQLMRMICRRGFEHHAAMNGSHSAAVLAEACETYLGWHVHVHRS